MKQSCGQIPNVYCIGCNQKRCTDFRYVAAHNNPGNITSRGMSTNELQECKLWWYGPNWLSQDKDHWLMWNVNEVSKEILVDIIKEIKRSKTMFEVSSAAGEGPLDITHESKGEESSKHNKLLQNNLKAPFEIMVKSFSSFCKLLRVTAWANIFTKNCRSKQKITGPLASSEITKARLQWIKYVQYEVIDTMSVKKFQNNDVITLKLKIDEDCTLRCHERFNNADTRANPGTYLLIYLSNNFIKNYLMLDHHVHYHKFETVTKSHKEELL